MYIKYFKRVIDLILSSVALILLLPLLIILTIIGVINMRGNPFFIQKRPGMNEKIFNIIKFRTMTNKTDNQGNLMPDSKRLTKYGKILRSTSLDELTELINIIKGDMSFIGPRPLSVMYLPFYTDEERKRHSVRPGLTGWAQVNGRNSTTWEQRFSYDLDYIKYVSFMFDLKIFFITIGKVLHRSDIGSRQENAQDGGLIDFDIYRQKTIEMDKLV